MRRRSETHKFHERLNTDETHKFDERLSADKVLLEAALENTGPGPRRNLLACTLRQIETALEIDGPSEGQPPKSSG